VSVRDTVAQPVRPALDTVATPATESTEMRAEVDSLKGRVAELEAEIGKLRVELRDLKQSLGS
jgi:hypothetical protein